MLTVRDRLAAPGRKFSLEFMPPRTAEEDPTLWRAVDRLKQLRPAFVSVTYGQGGSRRGKTAEVVGRIIADTDLTAVAHLVTVGHSAAELRATIDGFADAGVRDILALRGDPPGDPLGEWTKHPHGFSYAAELVELIKSMGDFSVGVAAFPEKHPRSPDLETDTRFYVDKVRAGADYGITQMLFSAESYLRLRDRVQAAGADVPLIPGIMPVLSFPRLIRICELSGQAIPVQLAERLSAVGDDAAAARAIGIDHAVEMAETLLDNDVPTLHFYTHNRANAVIDVLDRLGMNNPVPTVQT